MTPNVWGCVRPVVLGLGLILCRNVMLVASTSILLQIGYAQKPPPDQRGQDRQVRDKSSSDSPVQFAISTIKPANPGGGISLFALTPDGVSITNTSLSQIVRESFGVQEDRIRGIPDWAASKNLDIQAKVDPSDAPQLEKMTIEQRRQMVVSILTDRFNLRFHLEKRNLPVYAILVAKNIPKFRSVRSGSDKTPAEVCS